MQFILCVYVCVCVRVCVRVCACVFVCVRVDFDTYTYTHVSSSVSSLMHCTCACRSTISSSSTSLFACHSTRKYGQYSHAGRYLHRPFLALHPQTPAHLRQKSEKTKQITKQHIPTHSYKFTCCSKNSFFQSSG